MIGYGALPSPFVRKVRVTAIETGQPDIVAWTMVSIEERAKIVPQFNPLVKIPVVLLDDGRPLYDSPVICEYLDSLHDGPKMFPPSGDGRWTALRLQALGDGVGDAAIALGSERRRPEEFQYERYKEAQLRKLNNGLDVLEEEVNLLSRTVAIGPISAACALGYIDFRDPDLGWRLTRPNLAAWSAEFGQRPSMAETVPVQP